jgi:hypothetical protein
MRKCFALLFSICFAGSISTAARAASAPKTTGEADWINPWSGQQVSLSFNAIAVKTTGLAAKGSAIYTDPDVRYSMDVQFVKVDGNKVWFVGQVTDVTGGYSSCCQLGHWIFYEILEGREPGIGVDQIWGEDITQSRRALQAGARDETLGAMTLVSKEAVPEIGLGGKGMPIITGNFQVR